MMYKAYRTLIAMTILPFLVVGIPNPERSRTPNPSNSYNYPNAFPNADYVNGEDETENRLISGNEKDEEVNEENVSSEAVFEPRPQNGNKSF